MKGLIDNLQKMAVGAVEGQDPVKVYIAEVVSTNPVIVELKIKTQKIKIKNMWIGTGESYCAGDLVAVLQIQGGQQFLILKKVVRSDG